MTTTTHYVVRNAEGHGLGVKPGGFAWYPWPPFYRFTRSAAELAVAEHGGTVVEVTVTERPVGLRWVPRYQFPDHEAGLIDGEKEVAAVMWDRIYDEHHWYRLGGPRTKAPSFIAAKAAAEATVKAGWT